MYSNAPSLRLDTSALQADAGFLNVEKEKSPLASVRSRARSVSNLPSAFRSSTSPNTEKPPSSPLLTKAFDLPAGNKGKNELTKVLAFQLEQIAQRPKAPSILDSLSSLETQQSTAKGPIVVAQAIEKSISGNLNSLVNQEDSDDDEANVGFSSDQAANLTQHLRDILLVSLDRDVNLFEDDSSTDVFAQASKHKSASPFRMRRRSQSMTRSRSPSPTLRETATSEASALLLRCLRILQSLITEDCRFPIARPRPGLPPNALQAFCLDIAQILISLHSRSPAILSKIAFAILPAFTTFSSRMLPRLVQFFEESLLRDMLANAAALQRPFGSRDTILDDLEPPAVAIQVEEPDDVEFPDGSGWRRWMPRSEADRRLSSSNSPGQVAELYQLFSIVSPLLSAALERLDLESVPMDTRYRFGRLFETIIELKPDSYLDLLQTVAYHVPTSRRRGLSLLCSYWPRSLGHFTVSKPLPYVGPFARPSAPGHAHPTAHQFVPWRFGSRPRPVVFDGSSSNDCRVCLQAISEFGLFCPFCMCAVHYDCYDYPDGNIAVPYSVESNTSTQKLAVYRFCPTLPPRQSSVKPLKRSGHAFIQINLLATTLCFICREPLWGCWEQGLKCSECPVFAHPSCVTSTETPIEPCGTSVLHSGHISVSWSTFQTTFCSFYADCLSSDFATGARYEELSILSDAFFVQRQLLLNGLDLGCLVIQGYNTLPAFELDDLVNALHDALSARQVFLSPTLEEFLQENQLLYTQHSMLYDWPTLSFIASNIRTPSVEAMQTNDSSTSFLAAQPLANGSGDSGSNPSEVLTIAHLRDALGICFNVLSEPAARVLLSHLRHVGFYDRLGTSTVHKETFVRPEKILCVFPLPLGLDISVDVEILVTAIESSLEDIDLSVNEAGLLLLTRRFWPNQMATGYALQRLARAVIAWVINEDEHIAVILREYVSSGKPLPGVRSSSEKPAWPSGEGSRHASAANNGGDYVAHRRSLLQKYATVWLLAFHDQDIPFYANALYETIADLTEETSISEQVKAEDLAVYLADTSLRSIVRLTQASVVFTVFDDLLLRWLESTSDIWAVRKPVSTLTRLLGRDTGGGSRGSTARTTTMLSVTDSNMPSATDPWSIIMRAALSGRHSFQQALQWLAMMSSSGVDIPVAIFQQFSALSGRFDLDVVETLPLVSAAFCSIWLRSLGRQDLHTVIGALHLRLADKVVEGLRGNPNTWSDFVTFIRLSVATCLLVAGCEREKLLKNGFVHDHEVRDLPSRRSLNARNVGVQSDPINLSTRFIAALGEYVSTGVEQVAILVARFFSLFMRDSQHLETYEVDNFVLRNAAVLGSSAWKFYDLQIPELYCLRPHLLLHVLSVEPQPLETLFAEETAHSLPWDQRLRGLKRVFRIIMDAPSPDFNVDGRQWRSSVVFIFARYFRAIWLDPQEEVRTSVLAWSKTLLPAHFEQIGLCWNEAITKAPITERVKLVSLLMQLHVHFPTWQMLSWGAISETLREEDYLQQDNAADPADAHLEMYGVDSDAQDSVVPAAVDPEALSLFVSTVLLSLKLISAGLPVDTNNYMTVKFHLLRVLGFKNVAIVPSATAQSFYISYTKLQSVPDYAWPCADELLTLFDSANRLPVSPAMTSASQDEEQQPMLVGSIFVDVILTLIIDAPDFTLLPYMSAKMLLESLIVVIHKHDFDSKALGYLFGSLRAAAKRALSVALSEAPYDLRQLGVSVASAFIKTWRKDAGSFVPDALDICARVISSLGGNKEDVLVQQALGFMDLTLSAYGEQAILLALFKRKPEPALHAALKQATMGVNMMTAAGEVPLRDLLVSDTLTRINTPDADADTLQIILANLEMYLDSTHSQPLPIGLLLTLGTVFKGIIGRAAEWPADSFDPSVLISISTTAIQYNKANSRDLLLATETLLRAALARFHVSTRSLARLLEVTLDSNRRQKQGPVSSMNAVSNAFLEIYSGALRGETYMLSTTLKSMTEAVIEKFIEGDAKTGGDAVMWANRLPHDALKYLLAQGASQGQIESDFDASLRVAQMVFDGVEHSADFFHQGIQEHLNSKASRLSLKTWNIFVLASISRDLPQSAQALLRHFPIFAATFHECLLSPSTMGPTDKASTINHGYISIKLWLLLGKKLSDAALEPLHASNVLAFRFWNDLWPPFLRVLTMLMTGAHGGASSAMASVASTSVADLLLFLRDFHSIIYLEIVQQVAGLRKMQSTAHSEISNTKLDRTLREINNPVPLVPWQTLLDQARVDVIAAEKLDLLESHAQIPIPRPRDPGRHVYTDSRDSRIVS
ncbi:unnamed protein product [Peniophora sp. CBMAI 1063]|nr:unnamed protein product [Peniophora sp. CBMAI 1063]